MTGRSPTCTSGRSVHFVDRITLMHNFFQSSNSVVCKCQEIHSSFSYLEFLDKWKTWKKIRAFLSFQALKQYAIFSVIFLVLLTFKTFPVMRYSLCEKKDFRLIDQKHTTLICVMDRISRAEISSSQPEIAHK